MGATSPWPRSDGPSIAYVGLALQSGDREMLFFHNNGIYRLTDGKDTAEQVTNDNWARSTVACRTSNPDTILLLHGRGAYHIHARDGSFKQLTTEAWMHAHTAVLRPAGAHADAALFVFHLQGLYKVNPEDGKHQVVGKDHWRMAFASVYNPSDDKAYVFHGHGIFRVNLDDGSSEKVASGRWVEVIGAALAEDFKALVVMIGGVYNVDLRTGEYTKVDGSFWRAAASLSAVGAHGQCATWSIYQKNQQG